jgi:hypothetical protein
MPNPFQLEVLMAGSLDSRKAQEWRRRLARFQGARQTVAEFCRTEGISAPSFYQWRRRLAEWPRRSEEVAGFRPVRLVGSPGLEVELPGGIRLRVPTSDGQVLRLVMETLLHADAERAGGGQC